MSGTDLHSPHVGSEPAVALSHRRGHIDLVDHIELIDHIVVSDFRRQSLRSVDVAASSDGGVLRDER